MRRTGWALFEGKRSRESRTGRSTDFYFIFNFLFPVPGHLQINITSAPVQSQISPFVSRFLSHPMPNSAVPALLLHFGSSSPRKKNTTVRALTHLAFHPGSLISSGMLSGRQKSYGHRLFTDVEPAFISNPVIFQQVGKSNCYGFSVGRSSTFPPFHSSSITMPDELISSRRREGRVPTRCPPTVPKPTRTAHGHRIEAPLTILNSRIPEGGSPQTIPY